MEEPEATPHRPPVARSSIVRLFLIGAVATAGGIAAGLAIHWFPVQASSQAHKIDTLYDVLIVVTVPIFVLVETVVLFSAFKFRRLYLLKVFPVDDAQIVSDRMALSKGPGHAASLCDVKIREQIKACDLLETLRTTRWALVTVPDSLGHDRFDASKVPA